MRDSIGLTDGAFYAGTGGGSGCAGSDRESDRRRVDPLAAHGHARVLGDAGGAERAERASGLVHVQRLSRQQTTLTGRATGRRAASVKRVELDLGADIDAC
jgi:hypothetical protein